MTQISYATQGKTRSLPLSQSYLEQLTGVASRVDPSLGITITSAAQEALDPEKQRKGIKQKRTGSTRHDVDEHGEGHTSDIVLTRDGKTILPGQDKALYAKFMEEAAASGFTGIGHYSWGIHVGGGSQRAWGPSTNSDTLDPEFGAAIQRGWARGGTVERKPLGPVGGNSELADAIRKHAKRIGANPEDFATAISYETGGTFDPWKKGPATQWGQHEGFIQMGETQRQQFGYQQGKSIDELVGASADYLVANGFKPGMSGLDLYSTINAGAPGRYGASDAANGGASGDVADKWNNQMGDHRKKAQALLGGSYTPGSTSQPGFGGGASISSPNAPDVWVPKVETAPFTQLASDAFQSEQSLAWMSRNNRIAQMEPQDGYKLTKEMLDQDFNSRGIDPATYSNQLSMAQSPAAYEYAKGLIYEDHERLQRLQASGFTGAALQITNQMFDLATLPVDIAVGTVAPELILSKKAPRLYRAITGALAGGTAGAASNAAQVAVNPHRDSSDVIFGAILGVGFGGVAGALYKNAATAAEGAAVQRLGQDLAQGVETSHLPGIAEGSSAGARGVDVDGWLKDEAFALVQDNEVARTMFGRGRMSLASQLGGSRNPATRMASHLVQDGVGKQGGAINPFSASEDMSMFTDRWHGSLMKTYQPALKQWLKDTGVPFSDRYAAQFEFREQVARYVRDYREGRAERYHEAVRRMGDKIAKVQADIRKMAENPLYEEGSTGRAVSGFDQFGDNPNYLMRVWDARKVGNVEARYKGDTLERLIFGSMQSANPQVPIAVAQKAARGFARMLSKRVHGVEQMMFGRVSAENIDELADALVRHGGMSGEDARQLLRDIAGKSDDTGRASVAKHRTILDEKYGLRGADAPITKDGVRGDDLFIEDLLHNDAIELAMGYARKMAGQVSLARFRIKDPVTGELLLNGVTRDSEFDSFLRTVWKKGLDEGVSEADLKLDEKNLRFAYDFIKGTPNWAEDSFGAEAMRLLREFNFMRLMNQAGFAQAMEASRIVSSLGVKAAFSQMPALRRVVNMEGEAIRKSGLAEDLEALIGTSYDNLLGTIGRRMDDMAGQANSLDRGTSMQKLTALAQRGNRLTSVASGMAHVNDILQTWALKAIVQKFANMAANGVEYQGKRLADLGLDPGMAKRIAAQFNQPGNFEYAKGVLSGRKVVRAHFDRWSDPEAREAFIRATRRMATQIIQENDIGNFHRYISSPLGKVMIQFRTFVLAAYEKQTLRSLHMRDGRELAVVLSSMVTAALVYAVQENLKAIGRSDRDEYLERRLSWGNLALAGFARTGHSSLLPMAWDTGPSTILWGEPTFDFRTTGQPMQGVTGNPTVGFANDVIGAMSSVARPAIEGRSMSQEEARAVQRLAPFQNFLPLSALFNSLISGLPERSPKVRR
ncbi:hypothetical protein [Mesorhizobium sp. 8]|uniref:hypothetical protein n=1 Tax=Mesorhizobium sp. 8 TaxID=2584466 RepID=UPI00111F88A0|nr:hypothetical protein [Mesorhizobium sp. 8]QDB99517.1 hypothetical protein FGU64_03365 [Mesorhizobium sp. 8]